MAKVKPIPEGCHTLNPYIVVKDAAAAIDWYKKAFNAQEICRMPGPSGKIMHAELKLGDSTLMMSDEFPQMNSLSPESLGGSPTVIMMYLDNVDPIWEQAIKAGATAIVPLSNQFWGDRYGQMKDPFGHRWALATHVEDVSPEEMKKRQEEMAKQMTAHK